MNKKTIVFLFSFLLPLSISSKSLDSQKIIKKEKSLESKQEPQITDSMIDMGINCWF